MYNLLQPRPLFAPAAWGLFFIAGHSMQIYILLSQKLKIAFTEEEEDLYEKAFLPHGFTPRAFRSLVDEGEMALRAVHKGDFLYRQVLNSFCILKGAFFITGCICSNQGDPITDIGFLVNGSMIAVLNNNIVNKVQATHHDHDDEEEGVARDMHGGWCGELWDNDYDFSKEHKWAVSFKATEDSIVAMWNKKKLHDIMAASTSTQLAANHAQISDLWSKLRSSVCIHFLCSDFGRRAAVT